MARLSYGLLARAPGPRSIKTRLQRLVVLAVGLALICSAVLDIWQEAYSYLAEKRENLFATANVIAGAASNAVGSKNEHLARQALRSISRLPSLAYAKIEATDGRVLAEVGSTVRLGSELKLDASETGSLLTLLRTRTVQVTVPVILAGRTVGRLTLIGGTEDLAARFAGVLVTACLGAFLAIGTGLVVANRLQRSITKPLTALAADMARIAETHDYTASVPATADHETELLAGSFKSMMREIRKASIAISDREAELIFRLSRATEKRDNETGAHILRMAKLCRMVGEGLGLTEREVEDLHRAAPLHDVGKIGVPDHIIFKPGKLDPDERREMEQHTSYGYEILRDSDSALIQLAAEMAWSHHERWDGTGYPRGLKGRDIPLSGRVASIADVCDALASERPYKPAWTTEAVRTHLLQNSGSHFDPDCVASLLSRWDEVCQVYAKDAALDTNAELKIAS